MRLLEIQTMKIMTLKEIYVNIVRRKMYRNGLKSKVVLKKRELRRLVESKTKDIKDRFNYGL